MAYNPAMLRFVSFSVPSALYSPPLLITDVAGVVIASVSRTPSATDAAVTGVSLALANVTFEVLATAPVGPVVGALSCTVSVGRSF